MKKTLFILAAVTAIGLLVVACSGINPTAPVLGVSGDCPDFSGDYCVYYETQYSYEDSCYGYSYDGWDGCWCFTLTRNADGTYTYDDGDWSEILAIDCNGNFSVSGSWDEGCDARGTWSWTGTINFAAGTGSSVYTESGEYWCECTWSETYDEQWTFVDGCSGDSVQEEKRFRPGAGRANSPAVK